MGAGTQAGQKILHQEEILLQIIGFKHLMNALTLFATSESYFLFPHRHVIKAIEDWTLGMEFPEASVSYKGGSLKSHLVASGSAQSRNLTSIADIFAKKLHKKLKFELLWAKVYETIC